MSKYIDADKLIKFKEALADIIVSSQGICTYRDCKKIAESEALLLIATLQQEQPEPPSLIENAIVWFNNIAESAKKLSAGNVSHLGPTIAGMAIRSEEFLEKHKQEQPQVADASKMEQPEVDLEKEMEEYLGENWKDGTPIDVQDDMIKFARHFYELGLNARKEE